MRVWLKPGYYSRALAVAPRKIVFPQAETAAKKALSLDDDLGDARTTLASVKAVYNYDFEGAFAEYERTLQVHPNDATAHHWFAGDLGGVGSQRARGRRGEARSGTRSSLSHDQCKLRGTDVHAGQLDEAIAQLRETVEMDGSFYIGRGILGLALELKGQIPEARAEYEKAIALSDDPRALGSSRPPLWHDRPKGGGHEDPGATEGGARASLRRRFCASRRYPSVWGVSDQALSWLEQGFQERSGLAPLPSAYLHS